MFATKSNQMPLDTAVLKRLDVLEEIVLKIPEVSRKEQFLMKTYTSLLIGLSASLSNFMLRYLFQILKDKLKKEKSSKEN